MDITLLLLIYLAGQADRLRGAGFDFGLRVVDQLTYGLIISTVIYFNQEFSWLNVAVAVAFALGSAPGWGDSSASILHRRDLKEKELNSWQIGVLAKNKWLSATVRGMIWGLPIALLSYFDVKLISALIVMPASYIGAAYIAGFIPDKDSSFIVKDKWAWMETLRGWFSGYLFYLTTTLL